MWESTAPEEPERLEDEEEEEEDEEDGDHEQDGEHEDDDDFVEESDASTQASEDGDEGWGGDGDGDEDDEKGSKKNLCIHCYEDEDNDPSSDYEEGLECAICDAFSHRQCDRSANEEGGVKSAFDEDTSQWRCPNCASNGVEPGIQQPSTSRTPRSRRSSANTEQETRTLRKRKRPENEEEDDGPVTRRRKNRDKRRQTNGDQTPRFKEEEEIQAEGSEDGNGSISVHKKQMEDTRRQRIELSTTKEQNKFVLHVKNIDPDRLLNIVQQPSRPSRAGRSRTPSTLRQRARTSPIPPHHPDLDMASIMAKAEDKTPKPYGGLLSEAEANTSQTLPGSSERKRFDKAREQADDERKARTKFSESMAATTSRRKTENAGGASKIECIHFGDYEIDTWYAAPYPEEYSRNRVLWICEFCLKYMNSEYVCWRHKTKCGAKHPPGDEVYRDQSISVFEIDGRKNPVYCQNLCLLAKLFLGSKTLYYDVEPFLFYVMTECDENGMHFVGYFSKEKRSTSQNNVSCILTLPIHQRKGYGNLLIDFSYLLTRVEGKTGSPEKPFSDLGLVSYRNYWKLVLCYQLRDQREPLTIRELSERTGMTPDDIICGLEALNALVRDPITGLYALRLDYAAFQAQIDRWEAKGYVKLNDRALIWTPYLMGRSQAEHLNDMPMSTIAPRPGEEDAEEIREATEELTSAGKSAGDEKQGDRTSNNGSSTITNGDKAPSGGTEALFSQDEEMRDASVIISEKPEGENPATSGSSVHESSARSTPTIKLGPELPSSTTTSLSNNASLKKPTRSKSTSLSKSPLPETPAQVQPNVLEDIPPTRFEIVPPLPGTNIKKGRAGSSSVLRSSRKRTSISPAVTTPRNRGSAGITSAVATAPPATKSGVLPLGAATLTRRTRTKLADAMTVNGEGTYGVSEASGNPNNNVVTRDQTRESSQAGPSVAPGTPNFVGGRDDVAADGDSQGTPTTDLSPGAAQTGAAPGMRPGPIMVVASEV